MVNINSPRKDVSILSQCMNPIEEKEKEAIKAKLMQKIQQEEDKELVDNAFKDDEE